MHRAIPALLVLLFASTPCLARPKHWYKDWHTYVGEAAIIGSLLADGRSSCLGYSRGLVEGNALLHGSTSCGKAAAVLTVGGGIYTGLFIWEEKLNRGETNKWWLFAGDYSMPAIACAFHCTAAIKNYEKLPEVH